MHVIDVHNHLGYSIDENIGNKDELSAIMDECGITQSVIFAINEKNTGETYMHQNDRIIETVNERPKRYIGFCRVNPNAEKAAIEEMHRCESLGLSGLKLHPRSEDFLPKHCVGVLKAAVELKWPVIIHTDHHPHLNVLGWEPVFEKFSKLNFILGHGGKDHWKEAADISNRLGNVFIETSTLSYSRTKSLYKKVGSANIVFGSDYPYSHPFLEKKKYELIVEDKAELERIMYLNAKAIFRL